MKATEISINAIENTVLLFIWHQSKSSQFYVIYLSFYGILTFSSICQLIDYALKQVINLIPFNPIGSSSQFKTSREEKVSKFQKILRGTYNIRTTIRKEMGQDISGACGQLVLNQPSKSSVENSHPVSDIEDLCIR